MQRIAIYVRGTHGRWSPGNLAPNKIAARQIVLSLMDQAEFGREALRAEDIRVTTIQADTPERAVWVMRDQCKAWNNPFPSELTPTGEQLVIPGCERNSAPAVRQLSLWG